MATAPVIERNGPSSRRPRSARSNQAVISSAVAPIAWMPVLLVMLGFVVVHVIGIMRYGYFRDELYYISCAKRFDWGFVDQPPLSVGLLKLIAGPFGYPLWLVRAPAIASGAISGLIAALIARDLGGKKLAQVLAATMVVVSGTYLVVTHLYSMNSLDVLFWALAAWVWVGLGRTKKAWLWLVLGALMGLAILNKLSGLWLLSGIAVATLFTERRRDLARPEPWLALVLVGLCLTPYVAWQANHEWVTVEFMKNAVQSKLLPISAWMFMLREFAVMNPFSWPVWVVGVVVAVINPKWRPLALVWLTVLAILLVSGRARENYLSPAYAFIFAPGAIQFETWALKAKVWLKGYIGLLWVSGVAVAGIVTPLLPQEYAAEGIRRLSSISPTTVPTSEVGSKNDLHGLADMNGWPEMAREVDKVWISLPVAERSRAVVYTQNYGEASALEFFCKAPGLRVVGRQNNWWLWGPGGWDGAVAVVVGDVPASVSSRFSSFTVVRRLDLAYATPEEAHANIAVARGLKVPVSVFWKESRRIE